MKVLSCFDGISIARLALDRAGVNVEKYYASEIDKYAISISKKRWPDIEQVGDVKDIQGQVLCLSGVYDILKKYDNNIQDKFSEWEMLYWLNEEFHISAKIGTPITDEDSPESASLQCIEEIWISKCGMGDIVKTQRLIGGRTGGEDGHTQIQEILLQCGEWGYVYRSDSRNTEENITGVNGKKVKTREHRKDTTICNQTIQHTGISPEAFRNNKKSDVDTKEQEELLGGIEESQEWGASTSPNGKEYARRKVQDISSSLQKRNVFETITEREWLQLSIHNKMEATVVKNGKSIDIFLDRIGLLCGGSPCFTAGTLIKTIDGDKKIEDIREGDYVYTHKHRVRKVEKVGNKISSIIGVVKGHHGVYGDKYRSIIETTKDHPFYAKHVDDEINEDPKWIKAKDLSSDYYLATPSNYLGDGKPCFEWERIQGVCALKEVAIVYNIQVEEDHSYVADNVVVHNCQDLSIAKKNREGLKGGRSGLFWEYVRIRNEIKPKYFILENVNSMPKEAKQTITEVVGVDPIMLDASLVSAQSRKRLFWVGKLQEDGTYKTVDIPQPEDRKIFLKDILEAEVDEKYFVKISDKYGLKGLCEENEKSKAMTASMWKGYGNDGVTTVRVGEIGKGGQGYRIYSDEGKSVTLSANGGGRGATTGLYHIPHGFKKEKLEEADKYPTLCGQNPDSKHLLVSGAASRTYPRIPNGEPREKRIEVRGDGKANSMTTIQSDSMASIDYAIRKLTPVECERLQSLDDNYTALGIDEKGKEVNISNSQRYKVCGNGFNCEIIKHILSFLKL